MILLFVGLACMFLGYGTGVFEWHYFFILSNIIGMFFAYLGYVRTPTFRSTTFYYSLISYGLANLLFLALRLNNLDLERFPIENTVTRLLSMVAVLVTFVVLFYPSWAFTHVIMEEIKQKAIVSVSLFERKLLLWVHFGSLLTLSAAYLVSAFTFSVVVGLYISIHFVLLSLYGVKSHVGMKALSQGEAPEDVE